LVRTEPASEVQLDAAALALLVSVQKALIALSADIAGYGVFSTNLTPELEREIDRLSSTEPFRLRIPEGRLHVARTICRRAERSLVAYNPNHVGLPFVNRLSDYLYVLAEFSQKDRSK